MSTNRVFSIPNSSVNSDVEVTIEIGGTKTELTNGTHFTVVNTGNDAVVTLVTAPVGGSIVKIGQTTSVRHIAGTIVYDGSYNIDKHLFKKDSL